MNYPEPLRKSTPSVETWAHEGQRCMIWREILTTIWSELQPLFVAHYDEIAQYKDIPMDPSYSGYRRMELNGVLRTFTARVNGRLVGYFVATLMPHIHYQRNVFAIEDVIFLLPAYRAGGMGIGSKLLAFGERALAAEGAEVIVHHVKAAHPRLGEMLVRRGYELMDHVYTKRIR